MSVLHRLATAVITVATVLALTLALPGAASSTVAAAAKKPERKISLKGAEPKPNVFRIKGRVQGNWGGKKVIIQRQNCKKCDKWSKFKAVRTNKKARFATRVQALQRPGFVCYRARVPKTKQYRQSWSRKVCIRTYRF